MVLELHPGYVKVSWGLKECIPNLRLQGGGLLTFSYKIANIFTTKQRINKPFSAAQSVCLGAIKNKK